MSQIILHTWNKKLILAHKEKLTKTQRLIGVRSNGLHSEIQFSDRKAKISASATLQDECNGFRFKPIPYIHPHRQTRVVIECTDQQEDLMFAEACKMADVELTCMLSHLLNEPNQQIKESTINGCIYGIDNIKYDKLGVAFSFINKRRIWIPSGKKVWCNEACGMLLQLPWPDIFITDPEYYEMIDVIGDVPPKYILDSYNHKNPHDLTPDETEYLVQNYFERLAK